MTVAVCFKCGAIKFGAFLPCKGCGARPRSDDEVVVSVWMSDHHFSRAELDRMGAELAAGRPPVIGDRTKAELLEGLKAAQGVVPGLAASVAAPPPEPRGHGLRTDMSLEQVKAMAARLGLQSDELDRITPEEWARTSGDADAITRLFIGKNADIKAEASRREARAGPGQRGQAAVGSTGMNAVLAILNGILILPVIPVIVGLLVWSFFQPLSASIAFCALIVCIDGYLWLSEWLTRRRLNLAIWSPAEAAIVRKYWSFLLYPDGSRWCSATLNMTRMSAFLWVPWLLWNGVWSPAVLIPAALIGLHFFATLDLGERLDPMRFLADRARAGQREAVVELANLETVRAKVLGGTSTARAEEL